MRPLYFILGWIFFAVGVVGAFLPVLPTTPFMLLALWAFARSSERFYIWLYNHKLFGPPLQMWRQYQVIPVVAKIMSVSFMSISFLYMIIYSSLSIFLIIFIASIMLYGAWFILSKPSNPPKNHSVSGL